MEPDQRDINVHFKEQRSVVRRDYLWPQKKKPKSRWEKSLPSPLSSIFHLVKPHNLLQCEQNGKICSSKTKRVRSKQSQRCRRAAVTKAAQDVLSWHTQRPSSQTHQPSLHMLLYFSSCNKASGEEQCLVALSIHQVAYSFSWGLHMYSQLAALGSDLIPASLNCWVTFCLLPELTSLWKGFRSLADGSLG